MSSIKSKRKNYFMQGVPRFQKRQLYRLQEEDKKRYLKNTDKRIGQIVESRDGQY